MKRTMKKSISVLLTFTLLIGSLAFGFSDVDWADFAVKAKAEKTVETFTEGSYTYTVDENGNATITDFDNTVSGDIVIPSTLGGYPVTTIGNSAFYDCDSLTSVTIGNSVTSIGKWVFMCCTSLTSITVDSSNAAYSSDEYGVLFNKDKTELIQYPVGNTRTSYAIPDSVTSIGGYAFYYCTSLTSVTIPDSVTSIGGYAFFYCTSLTSVTIPDSVTSIGISVFRDCHNLTSITIPDSVTSIGQDAFYGCADLTSVTIGNSVTSIGSYAFESCTSLTNVTIGNSVTSIGQGAFIYCTSLTNVIIPDSVIYISSNAFYYCFALEYIHIPSSVASIGGFSVMSDSMRAEAIEYYKSLLENATEEELANGAKMGITKENIEKWSTIKTVICSDSEECFAKTYAEEIGNEFRVCDGSHRIEVPDEPTTEPTTVPVVEPTTQTVETTTQTAETTTKAEETTVPVTEASTTEPAEIPSTTQPVTTEPADVTTTTKPVETTNPVVEPTTSPTTKPITTKPTTTEPVATEPSTAVPTTKPVVEPTKPDTTKPVSTTKPEPIEEEIIKKPSTSEVKYGETLILHADFANIPEGVKIEWSVEGSGVTIAPSADGKTCAVTSTATGDVIITAKYVDANGVEHVSEQEIKSNASFWNKIVSFFKNLFGINRIIEQVFKF